MTIKTTGPLSIQDIDIEVGKADFSSDLNFLNGLMKPAVRPTQPNMNSFYGMTYYQRNVDGNCNNANVSNCNCNCGDINCLSTANCLPVGTLNCDTQKWLQNCIGNLNCATGYNCTSNQNCYSYNCNCDCVCDCGGGGDCASGGGSGGCFLTTATVLSFGLDDNCDELKYARLLRDNHMNSEKDKIVKDFYDFISPIIIERKTDWKDFYIKTVVPLTKLVKQEKYESAILLYKASTLKLIDKYVTNFKDDKHIVELIYELITKKKNSPYIIKYAVVKAFLKFKIIKREIVYYVINRKEF